MAFYWRIALKNSFGQLPLDPDLSYTLSLFLLLVGRACLELVGEECTQIYIKLQFTVRTMPDNDFRKLFFFAFFRLGDLSSNLMLHCGEPRTLFGAKWLRSGSEMAPE